MGMICYLAGLSPDQIAAFRNHAELASDFAQTSVTDQFDARRQAAFARLPPDVRQQYEQAKRDLIAQKPSLAQQSAKLDAKRPLLAELGPFEPLLELGKAWHVLHYLMTGHTDAAATPGNALLSGTPLGANLSYGPPRLHNPSETQAFRDFLAPLTAEILVSRLNFTVLAELRLYPLLGVPDAAEALSWRDEIAELFQRLKYYVGSAAERGDGILVWLS